MTKETLKVWAQCLLLAGVLYLFLVSVHLSNVASSLVNPLDQLAATAAE